MKARVRAKRRARKTLLGRKIIELKSVCTQRAAFFSMENGMKILDRLKRKK